MTQARPQLPISSAPDPTEPNLESITQDSSKDLLNISDVESRVSQEWGSSTEHLADLEASRREEFESVKAIYADDDIKVKEWEGRLGFTIRFGKVHLEVVTGPGYPAKSPLNITVTGLPYKEAIKTMETLTAIAEVKRGSLILFDLIDDVCTHLNGPEEDDEATMVAEDDVFQYITNADANRFMGRVTIDMIARRLAEDGVTILHTELVINSRLLRNFETMQARLASKYRDRSGDSQFTSTEVVFHGTQRRFISNIITRGFIKPGDVMNNNGDKLQVRCGSTYGRGIYTSPDPRYSMSYSDIADVADKRIPGQKLIVCAILMGRPLICHGSGAEMKLKSRPADGYDSHMSPSKFEYIVFNPAQVLPLYVLHVTDGHANLSSVWNRRIAQGPPARLTDPYDALAERRKTHITEIDESHTDLTLSMQRKIMTKLARKHFPFGFGPAQGDKFIVEEIGEVDEDEEEWGEYQQDRHAYQRDGPGVLFEIGDGKTQHERDEFQHARYRY
jgi:hypothetical protein